MTDQIKTKNEMLTSKVSYLEAKYISEALSNEKSKADLSMLKKRDRLITSLLPRDHGESVGLLLDFVILFTRVKSKCDMISNTLQLYHNLNSQSIEKATNFDFHHVYFRVIL